MHYRPAGRLQRLKVGWGHRQVSGVEMEGGQDRRSGQSQKQLSWLVARIYMVRGILQARILEWVAFPFSRGSSQPRDQTQVSCIEPKNTGVGSLSLLQQIFLTQESQGLLHCRRILYQ